MLTTKNRSLIRTRFTFQQNLNLKECIDGPLPHLCPAMYVHVRTCVSESQERCICLQVSRSSPGPHRRPSTCRVTLPPRSPSVTQPAQPPATPAPSTSRRYSLRCCWRRHEQASVYKYRRYTTSLGKKNDIWYPNAIKEKVRFASDMQFTLYLMNEFLRTSQLVLVYYM